LTPLSAGSTSPRQLVVALFLGVWATRLGTHIANRTMHITDDPRYAALIKDWGGDARWQMFLLLQKQAIVAPAGLAGCCRDAHGRVGRGDC
jgi:steroid 5-alpha reductase family enzyme